MSHEAGKDETDTDLWHMEGKLWKQNAALRAIDAEKNELFTIDYKQIISGGNAK